MKKTRIKTLHFAIGEPWKGKARKLSKTRCGRVVELPAKATTDSNAISCRRCIWLLNKEEEKAGE